VEILVDVEVLDSRHWKRANNKPDQPRTGANLVIILIRKLLSKYEGNRISSMLTV
jgi:hypothetical protein